MTSYRKKDDGGFTVIPGVGRLRPGDIVTGPYGNLPGLEEYTPPAAEPEPAAPVSSEGEGEEIDEGEGEGDAPPVVEGAPAAPVKRELPAAFKANQRKRKASAAAPKEGGE